MEKKRLSPFSIDFWLKKGYSEEEAEYKRNSIRPIKKEFWIEKGYNEEEAISKAKETKDNNNKKGAKKSAERDINEMKKTSVRCIDYWLNKGFSEDIAKQKVSEIQSFTLEKCIKKYGIIRGTERWVNRQEKWQNTLKSKSQKEIDNINKNKDAIGLKNFQSIDECIETLKKIRKMSLVKTSQEFIENLKIEMANNQFLKYTPIKKYLENVPNVQLQIFEHERIDIKKDIEHLFVDIGKHKIVKGNRQAYRKWTEDGSLLRSSLEIYFYDKFTSNFPNHEISIDKKYPNSSMRYDFMIGDYYIEICPQIFSDEKYKEKMMKKKSLFECILLSTIDEIDNFIDNFESDQ